MLEDGWNFFLETCVKQNNVETLELLFKILFTRSEHDEISKRIMIINELLNTNKTQRQIAHDIKVSVVNVSRGANVIKEYSEAISLLKLKKDIE